MSIDTRRTLLNLTLAKKFNHTMRYIDDLLTLNNSGFACKIDDIYPPELQFKRTTECPATLSYLDLLITIDNGKYSTSVFDKLPSYEQQHPGLWGVYFPAGTYR